jgi:hypothetical protein
MCEFNQELCLILVRDGILALVIALVGYWISRSLEKLKTSESILVELKKQTITLQTNLLQDIRERKLMHIENQLNNLYYPIFYMLQKDDALWRLSPRLSSAKESLPLEVNDIIETKFILKNHLDIVSIIESNSNLLQANAELQEQIQIYVKHVAIYETIYGVESLKDKYPEDFNSPYPKSFKALIEAQIQSLQKEYDELLNKNLS